MKRKLIPRSTSDKLAVAAIPFFLFLMVVSIGKGDYWWAVLFAVAIVMSLTGAYLLQDQASQSVDAKEYSAVIGNIAEIGRRLSSLSSFLEGERTRVAETEATVRRLTDEKNKLEPLVQTHRSTVEAILAAHADRANRSAWKERLIGFSLGVAASLIASYVFEYLKR